MVVSLKAITNKSLLFDWNGNWLNSYYKSRPNCTLISKLQFKQQKSKLKEGNIRFSNLEANLLNSDFRCKTVLFLYKIKLKMKF